MTNPGRGKILQCRPRRANSRRAPLAGRRYELGDAPRCEGTVAGMGFPEGGSLLISGPGRHGGESAVCSPTRSTAPENISISVLDKMSSFARRVVFKKQFLGVLGGAWAVARDRACSKELDSNRAGSWVLGHFRQSGIGQCVGPRKVWWSGSVWRGLAGLLPRSCRDKFDGTPLKSLKAWHFRQADIGGRVAQVAACSLYPSPNAKDGA